MNSNTGHGHVFKRPDGVRARCGGPSMCSQCARDQARMTTSATRAPARESDDVLERRALAMLTDDQAMASFIRWRTGLHGDRACESMRGQLGVQQYVDAIFSRMPA